MFIKPISAYLKSEQSDGRVGRPRKLVPREPNGRPVRDKHICCAAYIVALPNTNTIKVGSTSQLTHRMQQYKSRFGNEAVKLTALIVADVASARELEREAIRFFGEHGDREKREWFVLPLDRLPGLVKQLIDRSPVEILSVHGMGEQRPAKPAPHHAQVIEITKLIKANNRRQ